MKGEQAEADRALAHGLTALKVPLNISFHFFSQVQTRPHIFSFVFRTNIANLQFSEELAMLDVKRSVLLQTGTLVHKQSFILK